MPTSFFFHFIFGELRHIIKTSKLIEQERMELMKLTSRIKEIIVILLDQHEYITLQEISEAIQVSSRTVHRELENVEKFLEEKNIFLEKKKGIGIRLNLENHNVDEIRKWLDSEKTELIYTPDQRHIMLKAELLKETEPTKLYSLTHLLDVTESTISNDLDNIQDWFEKFDLELIRKPGLGVFVQGSEKATRRAIVALLYEHFHEIDLINFIINNEFSLPIKLYNNEIDSLVFTLIESSYLEVVKELLKTVEQTIGYQLADHSYIALIIRFLVTIKRVNQGLIIHIDEELKNQVRVDKIFNAIKRWLEAYENTGIKQLVDDELIYLSMHIKGAKLRETFAENSLSMVEDFRMIKLAKKVIRIAEIQTNTYLEDNEKLLNGLVRHLGPAINRIKLKLDVMNPLVKEIKLMYPYLFQVASECVKVIEEEEHIVVPEDEVAYIATHIGSAIKNEKRNNINKYRVVVACSSGIGTSQLLSTEIEKEFYNLDIVDIISTLEIDVDRIKQQNVDLIITTIPIPAIDIPTIQVNCILTEQNKIEIKKFLDELIPKKHITKYNKTLHLNEKINRLKQYCDTILEVLDNFKLIEEASIHDLKELIQFVSTLIVTSEEDRSELGKAFMDREEKGSTILGKKSMMLLHTRTTVIDTLHFMVVRGKDKIPIYNNKNILVHLDVIVVMVAPISIKSVELEVLSEISRNIITSGFADLLKTGTKEDIYYELSTIMDQFLQSKVIVIE